MKQKIIDLQTVNKIIINDSDVIELIREDNDTIRLDVKIMPEIIDSNFHELEGIITGLSNQLKRLETTVNKLEHKINILTELNKGR